MERARANTAMHTGAHTAMRTRVKAEAGYKSEGGGRADLRQHGARLPFFHHILPPFYRKCSGTHVCISSRGVCAWGWSRGVGVCVCVAANAARQARQERRHSSTDERCGTSHVRRRIQISKPIFTLRNPTQCHHHSLTHCHHHSLTATTTRPAIHHGCSSRKGSRQACSTHLLATTLREHPRT